MFHHWDRFPNKSQWDLAMVLREVMHCFAHRHCSTVLELLTRQPPMEREIDHIGATQEARREEEEGLSLFISLYIVMSVRDFIMIIDLNLKSRCVG